MSDSAKETSGLKERAAGLVGKLRGLSKPAMVMIATTLLAGIGLAVWLGIGATSEPYAVLYGKLSPEDAASVAEKLKELKAPYKVGNGGTIEVPESRVHELRLEVAGAGLPRGGGVGFESFDKMRLGATEFEQQVMFRRAMEGELSRTIVSVSAIESARVHLVLPEKSVFVQKRELGSASVIVRLKPGRDLGPQEIGAIVHLVSSAVPGLGADRVTLATTEGALLRKPRNAGSGQTADLEAPEDAGAATRTLENGLEERVRTMLDRVIGAGHADVRVRAEMDFSQVERTEDKFKPTSTALRSEELLIERNGGGEGDTVAGVPGAESNLPTGEAEVEETEAAAGAGVVRRQHTRNFEVDRVTEKRVNRVSTLKRLTVAVAVDGVTTVDETGARSVSLRDPAELEQIEKLVRSAVGADDRREDLVTVECIPFTFAAAEGEPVPQEAPSAAANPVEAYKKYVPHAAAAVIALAALATMVALRRARRRARDRAALALVAPTPIEALLAADPALPMLAEAREEALRRAAEDPATAALVIRHWLGGAQQEAQRAAV